MKAKRGATDLAGLLLIDKPSGMTSHSVVEAVRRATGERRVGHAGTLDPMATGLLVVLVGPYTRLERYLSAKSKAYDAVICFGAETDTDDSEGEVVRRLPMPTECFSADAARAVLDGLVGDSVQVPPAYSAIKVEGRTAHRAARAGDHLELEARPITVYEADLVSVDSGSATWTVRFAVSKGTYIRALARDIGRSCGSAAHLCSLRRTASGPLSISQAVRLADVGLTADVRALFTDPLQALDMQVLELDPAQAAYVRNGRPFDDECVGDGPVALTVNGRLVGIYRCSGGRLVAETVLGVPE